MSGSYGEEAAIRLAAMDWLDNRPTPRVDFAWLSGFEFDGTRIPLMDRQRGIRKPAGMNAALAIRTTFTAPNQVPPYNDAIGADGLQRYKYRGSDPQHPENVALRRARDQNLPLIWFVGVAPGLYEPIYPVWVVGDDPTNLEFALALDEGQRFVTPGRVVDEGSRRYVERLTKSRLHQRVFRSQVLLAYEGRCAICKIRHAELLDAAHIIADGQPHGEPVVPNGLSLCKIHHAAFDSSILGIRPDLTLHVRQDILEEVDGWMLKGGIQGVHDTSLAVVPRTRAARPSKDRLEERYASFLATA
ncbi:HNH endonuclease [Nocardioides humi]|uniref:HNH endonuclease n=2 Tax=Nocardioides humi TaxID=449461 RepID=A0ABN1ZWJ3_9ACTN